MPSSLFAKRGIGLLAPLAGMFRSSLLRSPAGAYRRSQRSTDRSVLDVLLEPGNVGALTFAAAWGFHHDRNARRTHDFR